MLTDSIVIDDVELVVSVSLDRLCGPNGRILASEFLDFFCPLKCDRLWTDDQRFGVVYYGESDGLRCFPQSHLVSDHSTAASTITEFHSYILERKQRNECVYLKIGIFFDTNCVQILPTFRFL